MTTWISASDVQAWIGADNVDNTTAAALATAATDAVRGYIERDVELGTFDEIYDSTGTNYILLNHWPVRTITAVKIETVPVVPASFNHPGWRMDGFLPRKLIFAGRGIIPRGVMNVEIAYTAGYDLAQAAGSTTGLPADLATALKLTAAAIANAQAADPNLAGESTGGVFSGSFYPTGVGAVPPGARSLLQRFKRVAP
jgi:hypothetical protein